MRIARDGYRHQRRSTSRWMCSLVGGSAQGLSRPLRSSTLCAIIRLLVAVRGRAEIGAAEPAEISLHTGAVRNDASGEPRREWIGARPMVFWRTVALDPLAQVAPTSIGSTRRALVQTGSGLTLGLPVVLEPSGSQALRGHGSKIRNPVSGAGRVNTRHQGGRRSVCGLRDRLGSLDSRGIRGGQSPRARQSRRRCDVLESQTYLDPLWIVLS